MLDYALLKLIWWGLIITLFTGFVVTDGFDMGALALLGFFKKDEERRAILNSVGRFWDGNQVWLLTAAGATFACWPFVYSMVFSGLYLAFLILLITLILRPAGFEFRSKMQTPKGRQAWDFALIASGVVPPLILGVGAGNILQGLPFGYDEFLRPHYTGSFFSLFNPFALLCGLCAVLLFAMHGASWLRLTIDLSMQPILRRIHTISSILLLVLFSLAAVYAYFLPGFRIDSPFNPSAALLILDKSVSLTAHGPLRNYLSHPWMLAAPALSFLGLLLVLVCGLLRKDALAFLGSALSLAGAVLIFFFSLFPFVVPSITEPQASLTLWDAPSSRLTLWIMLLVAVVMVPIILSYTLWAYTRLWGRIRLQSVKEAETHIVY